MRSFPATIRGPFLAFPINALFGCWNSHIFPPDIAFRGQQNVCEKAVPSKSGDRIRIGSADFMVTQPRMPCFKLGIRFNRMDMVKHFLASKRTGFYLSVIREGEVKNGDAIEFIEKQETGVTITDIVNLYSIDSQNQELLRRATQVPALPQSWKDFFRKRLWDADA